MGIALLACLGILPVARGQDPHQAFAAEGLGALARGDRSRLECLVLEAPFRAVRLVHELLFEASVAALDDRQALEAARGISLAYREVTLDGGLIQRVQDLETRRTSLRPGARAFKASFEKAIADFDRRDWAAFEIDLDRAQDETLGEPYLEWRLGRLALAAHDARGELSDRRLQCERLVELARELEMGDAEAQDLGVLAEIALTQGHWESARDLYRQAVDLAFELGDIPMGARLSLGLGSAQAKLGLYEAARRSLVRAARVHHSEGALEDEAYARLQVSFLEGSSAHYTRALTSGRRALGIYRKLGNARGQARSRIHLAAVQSELGLLVDAEREISLALTALGEEGNSLDRARAQLTLGLARLDAGQHRGALEVLEVARRLFRDRGDEGGMAEANTLCARGLLAMGEVEAAERCLHAVLNGPRHPGDELRRSLAWTTMGELRARTERWEAARDAYRMGVRVGEGAAGPEGAWRAHFGLGKLAERDGDPDAALDAYTTAIGVVEEIRRVLSAPSLRLRYLGDKLELYRRATLLLGRRGDLDRAFRMSERLRSRTLLEIAALRPAHQPEGITNGSAHLRAVESRLTLLETDLRQSADTTGRRVLQARIEEVRGEHAAARRSHAIENSRAALLSGIPEPVELRDVCSRLAPAEALLAYVTSESETSVFVLRRGGASLVDLRIDGSRLAGHVDRLLRPSQLLRDGRTDVVNLGFDARIARELYESLVLPTLPELVGCERLWIVADGPLRSLPFAALVEDIDRSPVEGEGLHVHHRRSRYLIESLEIAYLPSAGFLGSGRESHGDGTVVFAAPEPLPAGAQPLGESARTGIGSSPAPRSHVGRDATEASFKRLAPGARVLHIATHGYLDDRRPAYSRVALASGEGEDGWLHAFEVEGLALDAQCVVLAACETLGARGRGEGLLGLARAFLVAGARSVIATGWRVDDGATSWLMNRYHEALRSGASPSKALRQAQIATLREGGRAHLSYANPFFWAGFFQLGEG